MNTEPTEGGRCRHCGEPIDSLLHLVECDGRQGKVEAFDDPVLLARHSDPETSHESMELLDPLEMRRAADVAIALHRRYGPLADFQFRDRFRAAWPRGCAHLYRQARSIARDEGLIRDSGERRVNPATGRKQVVWEACDLPPVEIVKCECCGHVLRRAKPEKTS